MVRRAIFAAVGSDNVEAILLIGSFARGAQVRSSDLDIMVRGRQPLSWSNLARLREAFDDSDLPYWVDIVDYHQVEISLRGKMLADGKIIYPGATD
jgi:predicted nucleotidyltransferase